MRRSDFPQPEEAGLSSERLERAFGLLERAVRNGSLMGAKMSSLTNRIRKDVVEVTKRMTNFELSETLSFMNNYVAALFLPHTDTNQFPKLNARLETRRALQQ